MDRRDEPRGAAGAPPDPNYVFPGLRRFVAEAAGRRGLPPAEAERLAARACSAAPLKSASALLGQAAPGLTPGAALAAIEGAEAMAEPLRVAAEAVAAGAAFARAGLGLAPPPRAPRAGGER